MVIRPDYQNISLRSTPAECGTKLAVIFCRSLDNNRVAVKNFFLLDFPVLYTYLLHYCPVCASPIIHLFDTEAPDGATAVAVDVSASPDTPKRDNSDTMSEATYTEDATDNVDSAMAAIAADMGFTIEGNGDFVPDDLRDLRHRFNYLKNLYDIKEQVRQELIVL